MKTRIKTLSLFFAASVGVLVAMQPWNGRADGQPATAVQEGNYDLVIHEGSVMKDSLHQETPATLKAVVEKLRQRYDEANIVYAPELANLHIPDLKLRAHDLPEMLEALRAASGDKFDWTGPRSQEPNLAGQRVPPGAIDPATGLPVAATPTADGSSGLFVLREPTRTEQNERVVEAFNIEPLVRTKMREAGVKADDPDYQKKAYNYADAASKMAIELAISTAADFERLNAEEVSRKLDFRYHPGAALLIVIGPKEDVEVARKVFNALNREVTASSGSSSGTSFRSHLEKTVTGAGGASGGTGGQGSPGEHGPLSTEVLALKYADVSTATQTAFALLTDSRSKIVPDQRAKTLVVVATPGELISIKKAIEQLDLASKPSVGDNPAKAR